jgi:hypothetical protein
LPLIVASQQAHKDKASKGGFIVANSTFNHKTHH